MRFSRPGDPLTARQRQVLDFIECEIRTRQRPPTMREIADHFGWASYAASAFHIDALRRKGYLRSEPAKSRALQIVPRPSQAHPDTLRGLTDLIVAYAADPQFDALSPDDVIACAQVAASRLREKAEVA